MLKVDKLVVRPGRGLPRLTDTERERKKERE